MFVFLAFFFWRIIDFAIAFITPRIIPYLGFFPYGEMLKEYALPSFLTSFANFDGAQYITLVREGYNTYTQAYFPLYFLLVRIFSFLFPTPGLVRPHNDLLAALFVSNLFFFSGLVLFYTYLTDVYPKKSAFVSWVFVFLLLFPTSFFFGAVYTEGLFFFFFAGVLFFLKKKKYVSAFVLAASASLTRLMGVFLFIPFAFALFSDKKIHPKNRFFKNLLYVFFMMSSFFGFLGYTVYLWITVGDPFFFFHAQPAFGAHRSTSLIFLPQVYYRYIKIFLTAQMNFQYFISVIECFIFTFVFVVLVLDLIRQLSLQTKNFDRIAINLFSFINILLPTLTGTFSSIPRYALFSFSLFFFLGEIKRTVIKICIGVLFLIFHVILLAYFVQGYFVG